MKIITVLGSTGSIGTQTLDVVRNSNGLFKIEALTAKSNYKLLYNQAVEFKPEYCVIDDEEGYEYLKDHLNIYGVKVLKGYDALNFVSTIDKVDIVVNSVLGMIGLEPTISAIKANKTIALANKETMVVGGEIIKNIIKKYNASIIPVDSEHNAIFQCLKNGKHEEVKKLILTASGGPFRNMKRSELKNVTPEMAVNHPRWHMGKKISVDSATLMNKGLEVIEAHYLFDMPYDNIDVVIHPQSIVHSMVEYIDGSIISQMSTTDMRHPIQYSLNYPERIKTTSEYLDLFNVGPLTFEKPDRETFKALDICYRAGKIGGTMPVAINAANEEAVNLFLNRKIKFLDIEKILEEVLSTHNASYDINIDVINNIQKEYTEFVDKLVK